MRVVRIPYIVDMSSIWAAVNDWINVDRFAAIIGALGFLFGVFYGSRGHRLAKQMRAEALQPMVVVSVGPAANDRDVMVLSVENIGPSIAKHVRISVSPPILRSFDDAKETPMHAWHVFTEGIPALPPKAKFDYMFDIGSRRFSSDLPRRYRFEVDAHGPLGKIDTLVYDIDLEPMRDMWVGQTTIKNIVNAIDAVGNGIKSMTSEVQSMTAGMERIAARLELDQDLRPPSQMSPEEHLGNADAAGPIFQDSLAAK